MDTIIGVDTHISTCDFCAMHEDGSVVQAGRFPTSAFEMRRVIKAIPGRSKVLVIEQGPLADWIRRIITPSGTRVVVSETRRNSWIARDQVKGDAIDAEKLAHLFRGGFVKEVVAREEKNEPLLRLVLQHHDLTRQFTQVKNKLKAKFRQNGIRAIGVSVYHKEHRNKWLCQLPEHSSLRHPLQQYFAQLDLIESQIKETDRLLAVQCRKYPIVSVLSKQYPGVGLIVASTFVALIDTPLRFSTVRKVWTYCGLGIDIRHSGLGKPMARLTYRGNRILKYVLNSAVHTALRVSHENHYKEEFLRRIAGGQPEYKAKLVCVRKLAKDMWLTWRKLEIDK